MIDRIIDTIALYSKKDKDLIGEETNIFDLEIDSLSFIKIIMDIETAYSVRFEDEEIVEIRTAKDIENALFKKYENK
jgi:acyl carrier protein